MPDPPLFDHIGIARYPTASAVHVTPPSPLAGEGSSILPWTTMGEGAIFAEGHSSIREIGVTTGDLELPHEATLTDASYVLLQQINRGGQEHDSDPSQGTYLPGSAPTQRQETERSP